MSKFTEHKLEQSFCEQLTQQSYLHSLESVKFCKSESHFDKHIAKLEGRRYQKHEKENK